MIDDDFHPHRLQMRALGHLLEHAHKHPRQQLLEEGELYRRVYMDDHLPGNDVERQEWLKDLESVGLIAISPDRWHGDGAAHPPLRVNDVALTPAGAFYAISRSFMFAENARTPTDDFPDEIVDAPFVIQSYYAPETNDYLPASDRAVSFDHNSPEYQEAVSSIDAVEDALRDNEFGSLYPDVRDEALRELRQIRELLEEANVPLSRLRLMAWGTFGFLATEFASRPIGYLAEQAWQAISALIGVA